MSVEKASEENATARALRSRIFYVIQVVLFVLSVASLIIIIVVEYVGNTGGACLTLSNNCHLQMMKLFSPEKSDASEETLQKLCPYEFLMDDGICDDKSSTKIL